MKAKYDKETIAALQASIEHWQELAGSTITPENVTYIKIGVGNCKLCYLFHPWYWGSEKGKCLGCPVRDKTGLWGCGGTPYMKVSEIKQSFLSYDGSDNAEERILEIKESIQEELDFLVSLKKEITGK